MQTRSIDSFRVIDLSRGPRLGSDPYRVEGLHIDDTTIGPLRDALVEVLGTATDHGYNEVRDFQLPRSHALITVDPTDLEEGQAPGRMWLVGYQAQRGVALFARTGRGVRPSSVGPFIANDLFQDSVLPNPVDIGPAPGVFQGARNVRMELTLEPDRLTVGRAPNGAIGLNLPLRLDLESPVTLRAECDEGDGSGLLSDTQCNEIIRNANNAVRGAIVGVGLTASVACALANATACALVAASAVILAGPVVQCKRVLVEAKIEELPGALTFVPARREFCDPRTVDRSQASLEALPDGKRYTQPCFDVISQISVGPEVAFFTDADLFDSGLSSFDEVRNSTVALAIGADVSCGAALQTVCALIRGFTANAVNCADIVGGEVEERLVPRLLEASQEISSGIAPFTSFDGELPRPASACNAFDPTCLSRVTNQFLPAAFEQLSLGWFANAVGSFPSAERPRAYDYPIVDVQTYAEGCGPGRTEGRLPTGERVCATRGTCVGPDCAGGGLDALGTCSIAPGCRITDGVCHRTCGPEYAGLCSNPDDPLPAQCVYVPEEYVAAPQGGGVYLQYAVDVDGDEVVDENDNCPRLSNPPQIDQDGDGLGDACDACPRISDGPSVLESVDRDGDGLGDICDWNYRFPSSNDPDRDFNKEAALSLDLRFRAELSPLTPLCRDQQCSASYSALFRDGIDEAMPAPVLEVSEGGYMPPNRLGQRASCAGAPSALECISVLRNRVRFRPEVPYRGFPGDGSVVEANVGLSFCACEDPYTELGRAKCRSREDSPCAAVGAGTPADLGWLPVSTFEASALPINYGGADWPTAPSLAPRPVRFEVDAVGRSVRQLDLFVDYSVLAGPGCAGSPEPFDPLRPRVCGLGSGDIARGMLWANTRTSTNPVRDSREGATQPLSPEDIQNRGTYVWGGVLGSESAFSARLQTCATSRGLGCLDWDVECVSGECDISGRLPVYVDLTQPDFLGVGATSNGPRLFDARPLFGPVATQVLREVSSDASTLLLKPAEPLGSLVGRRTATLLERGAALAVPSGAPRAVFLSQGLNGVTGAVDFTAELPDEGVQGGAVFLFDAAARDGVRLRGSSAAVTNPIRDRQGVVWSATRGEVLAFGSGTRWPQGTVARLSAGGWVNTTVLPWTAPADVLAATYDSPSGRYIVVDRVGLFVWVRSYDPTTARFTVLARFPLVWAAFDQHDLVPAPDGALYFSATRPGSTVVAKLELDATPRARVAGVKLLPRRTVLAPRGGYEGVVLMTETQAHGRRDIYRETIARGEFTARLPAWCELR